VLSLTLLRLALLSLALLSLALLSLALLRLALLRLALLRLALLRLALLRLALLSLALLRLALLRLSRAQNKGREGNCSEERSNSALSIESGNLKHEGNIMTKLRTVLLAAAAAAGLTGIAGRNAAERCRGKLQSRAERPPGLRPVGALLSDTSACLPGL
jgi:hypothetical protein